MNARTPYDVRQNIIEAVRNGTVSQAEVAREFGVTPAAVTKFMKWARRSDSIIVPDFNSCAQPRDWIKALAKKYALNAKDLMVLKEMNDPFYAGGPAQWKLARWFAALWEQEFKGKAGIHIRRIHYRADAIAYKKLDGKAYVNAGTANDPDYDMLGKAAKYARNLGLVDPRGFVDNRNDAPGPLNWERADDEDDTTPQAHIPYFDANFPRVRVSNLELDWSIPDAQVDGYERDDFLDRQFYCEIWIEKSTMNDLLEPICRQLGVRLITSIGTQSITNAIALMDRAIAIRKPTRSFYVSDHDRKGTEMPLIVSRHIEFWKKKLRLDVDIKLFPTCLTEEQIVRLNLPRNKRTRATELDALEGRMPGEFEKIIRAAVTPYCDVLDNELEEAEREANDLAQDEWDETIGPYREKLAKLQKKVERVTKQYQREAESLNRRLAKDIKQFQVPHDELVREIEEHIQNFNPDIPDRPGPDDYEIDIDESGALFDTGRQYFPEQLAAFKQYQAAIDRVMPKLKPKRTEKGE